MKIVEDEAVEHKKSIIECFNLGVLRLIWYKILVILIWTISIVCIHKYSILQLNLEPNFITVVNVVISMILAFRTNTAYDRFWEGRRLWGTLYTGVRNMGRLIWVNTKDQSPQDVLEKKHAVMMVAGLVFSIKHHLRDEYGQEHVQSFFPHLKLKDKKNAFSDENNTILLDNAAYSSKIHTPLEITHHIGSYLTHVRDKNLMDIQIYTASQNVLITIVDTLSSLERIRTTPLPRAYTLHLSHVLWMYLLMLPFQMLKVYGWWTVLVCVLSAFCFLGIEDMAYEIENPFGYDVNDLKVDKFCDEMREELEALMQAPPMKVTEWVISEATVVQ